MLSNNEPFHCNSDRYNNVHEILHNRAVLHKFSMRMKNSHLISSFSAWNHYTELRVHVRRTMTKHLNALIRADEVQAIEQWKRFSQWYERHAHEQDHHQLTTKIHALESELQVCQNELEEFRTVFNRKRDKFVNALKARVAHQRIRKCIQMWRSMAHSRVSARRTINRLLNKQLSSAWHSWVSHDAALREDIHLRTMAGQERAREIERKKIILNRTLKHMQQSKLSALFRTWKSYAADAVRERFVLNRFVLRWKNMDLHRNFLSWVSFTEMILHQKATARKVLNRIVLKNEVAAWQQWVHVTTVLRQHDKEAQEQERTKIHNDLILIRFVKRWKSLDLNRRFVTWKDYWRHNKYTKETQNALAQLRSEYESKIGSIQAAREQEQAFRIRKTLAAWLNNHLSVLFHRWRELVSRNVRERNIVAKFVLQWQKSSLVAAYRSWVYKVRHVKRSRRIVANMRASTGRRLKMKLFRGWVAVSAETAKDRRLLKRFGQRWRNMGLTRVWLSWLEYVGLRKHARDLVNMFFGRWTNQKISKGFRAWLTFCNRYDTYKMTEQLKADAMLERHKTAALELETKQASAKRMLRHMLQRNLSRTFRSWQVNVTEIIRIRGIMQKFGMRMTKSGMFKAFTQWITFLDHRKLARKVLNQMSNRKLHGAWKTWIKYSIWISSWTAENAVKKVEELTIALNRIRTRSVKTLLWDRYKEIMGTAMHAWYLTIVHDRENEHKRHEEEEHKHLGEALKREAAEHAKYEEALAKGVTQQTALADLEKGLEDVRQLTIQEHAKFEQARAEEIEEHSRLEAALQREAAEHAKYEEAMAQGASQKVALENLNKGLISARQTSAEEHRKYEATKRQLAVKDEELANKPKLARALISSVWHKHKSQIRAKQKLKITTQMRQQRDEAVSKLKASRSDNNGHHSGQSAWAIARAGVRGIKGTNGRNSPSNVRASPTMALFASTNGPETNGRAIQRTLEGINDIVHTLATATNIEQQCTLIRALCGQLLRADNVDLFVKSKHSFWTASEGVHRNTAEEKNNKMKVQGNRESWPLNEKGGIVAAAILQGHIMDVENALMEKLYQPSPDMSPSGAPHRTATLAVLVVPLLDKHGKTIGALRASRGTSSKDAFDSFSSIDGLLMCIFAAVVQCTWTFTKTKGSVAMASDNEGEAILRSAIHEFDLSHATTVQRLSAEYIYNTRAQVPPQQQQQQQQQQYSQQYPQQYPQNPQRYQQAYQQPSLPPPPPLFRQAAPIGRGIGGYHAFRPTSSSATKQRDRDMNVRDLTNFTPSYRSSDRARGVVSFVHQEY